MTRLWSIRARTALAFALCSMVLTTGVLAFVNVASVVSIERTIVGGVAEDPSGGATEPWSGRASALPDPEFDGPPSEVAIVAAFAGNQRLWSVIGVLGAGVLAAGLGWAVSRRMLRPIDRITDIARRISASNLCERIALDGPDDELRRLSRTIDSLLDRLETAFESQRRFVAQASHELRTPLAVQRTAMQVGLHAGAEPDEVAATRDELLEQNRRTEHLVESLLVLAEADRGLDDHVQPVCLDAVVDEVLHGASAAAARAEVRVERSCSGGPPAVAPAEPMLVRQLVANLVDNAIEYNEPGGFVWVSSGVDGLVVENSGPVVPGEVVTTLVEPFRRCGPEGSRRHSGLGLSIVAAIVRAHGWRLLVEARPLGGLRVTIVAAQPR